jgi:hypothetical protein
MMGGKIIPVDAADEGAGIKIKIADILRKLPEQYNLLYFPKIQIQSAQGITYDRQNRFTH